MEEVKRLGLREAYGEALVELGRENKDVVVVAADLAGSTKVDKFAKEFPKRFFNLGVAEPDAVSTCAGLAAGGKIVFFSTFAIFGTGLAWGQIRQNICYPNLAVKLVLTHGGITVGEDGASHQALEDIALTRVLPNMKVIVPADAQETKAVVKAALEIPGPCYIRLTREKSPVIYEESLVFVSGRGRIHSYGKDATIIAAGPLVWEAFRAREELEEKYGLSVGVINMASIKPIDRISVRVAASVAKMLVTLEDHSVIGGLGSAVAEILADYNFPQPLKILGIPDCFGESGKPEELLRKFGLTKEKIIETILKTLKV